MGVYILIQIARIGNTDVTDADLLSDFSDRLKDMFSVRLAIKNVRRRKNKSKHVRQRKEPCDFYGTDVGRDTCQSPLRPCRRVVKVPQGRRTLSPPRTVQNNQVGSSEQMTCHSGHP